MDRRAWKKPEVDPEKGLILRGHPISELTSRLPEEMFYLLFSYLGGASSLAMSMYLCHFPSDSFFRMSRTLP